MWSCWWNCLNGWDDDGWLGSCCKLVVVDIVEVGVNGVFGIVFSD